MKSIKVRAKSKKTNGRVRFSPKDRLSPIDPDLSNLRPPIDTGVTTLLHVSQLLENGSDEVKSILSYECDLLYECRVCRSLFRSLANLISHKRVYCLKKCNVAFYRGASNDYDSVRQAKPNKSASYWKVTENVLQNIVLESLEQRPARVVQENCPNDRILRSQVPREERKRDLTAVIGMLQKKQSKIRTPESRPVFLEDIRSNPCAVYQTLDSETETVDLMNTQVTEVQSLLTKDTLVLGPDGRCVQNDKIEKNGKASGSEEDNDIGNDATLDSLVCSICSAKFATRKTLMAHTKSLHTSQRMCYPCPCCSSTFTSTWSVYRHLFKVHRMSNEQVRKLRSQVQQKAFRNDSTVAENLEKAKPLEDSNLLGMDSTQEWINQLESDSDLQRCGGCGKRFDRKAALSSHLQYCQRRMAVYSKHSKPKPVSKLVETLSPVQPVASESTKTLQKRTVEADSISSECNEMSIRVEAVASLSKEDWDKLDNDYLLETGPSNLVSSTVNVGYGVRSSENSRRTPKSSETPEIICTDVIRGSRKRKMKLKRCVKRLILDPGERARIAQKTTRLDHAQLMERKVASIANLQRLQCLPCKQKFTSVTNLRRHVAIHIGWNRYRCKLCPFKCFVKCDCVAHCNKQHNAQNDRTRIAEMMEQIPDDGECELEKDLLDQPKVVDAEVETVEDNVETTVEVSQTSPGKTSSETGSEVLARSEVKSEASKEVVENELREEVRDAVEEEPEVKVEARVEETEVDKDVEDPPTESLREEAVPEVISICDETVEDAVPSKEVEETRVESRIEEHRIETPMETHEQSQVSEENEQEQDHEEEEEEDEEEDEDEEASSDKLEGVLQNHQRVSKLDADPALRKMVMEVIFGNAVPFAQPEAERVSTNDKKREIFGKTSKPKKLKSKDLKDATSTSKEITEDGTKPQRPIRNRIKPLHKDFVYDLREAVTYRKDVGLRREGFGKLEKKELLETQEDCGFEDDDEEEVLKGFEDLILPYNNDIMENVDVIAGESLANSLALSQC